MKVRHYPGLPAPAPLQRWAAALLCGTLLAVAGCGGSKPQALRTAPPAPRDWPVVQADDPAAATSVLMRAIGLVGTPYRYGGNTPESGFDCSGLVTYVYRDMLDLRLPRTSRELAQIQGPRIAPEKLAAADLVFFGSKGSVSHVGIYVGEGRFLHSPSRGKDVRVDSLLTGYWANRYLSGRRVAM